MISAENIEKKFFSGAGNLFTAIDNRHYKLEKKFFSINASTLTAKNSKLPKGTEGIIVLNPIYIHNNNSINNNHKFIKQENLDFEVWFFNPDGSSGMMCGNGGRSAINFAYEQNYLSNKHLSLSNGKENISASFVMSDKVYTGFINKKITGIYFPSPTKISDIIELQIDNKIFIGRYINIGTDHFVTKVENVSTEDVENNGRKIRFNKLFQPDGVNSNFYSEITPTNLKIRTYERGVERETGACGTGAISTAITHYINTNEKNINLMPSSGLALNVELFLDNEFSTNNIFNISKILLSGEVQEIK